MSIKRITQYHTDMGSIYLLQDDSNYGVYSEMAFSELTGMSNTHNRMRTFASFNAALTEYTKYWNKLNGIVPAPRVTEPLRHCAFGAGTCQCRAKNCPASLGGRAFWQLFRSNCLYRTK